MNESVEKFHRIVEEARKLNCETCASQKVCFLQKQIENLADRMTQPPFDTYACPAADRERKVVKRDKIDRELKGIIASNCPLYVWKDQYAAGCGKRS